MLEFSGKLCVLLEIIKLARSKKEKVLVFTQSIGTLDMIEDALTRKIPDVWPHKWRRDDDFLRLEGLTNASDRKFMIRRFSIPNQAPYVFLMSVKV